MFLFWSSVVSSSKKALHLPLDSVLFLHLTNLFSIFIFGLFTGPNWILFHSFSNSLWILCKLMGGGHVLLSKDPPKDLSIKLHDLESWLSSCARMSLSFSLFGRWSVRFCDMFLSAWLSVESQSCCRLDPCRMFLSLQHSACQSACSVEFKKGKKEQNCPFHPQLFEQHPKISASTCLTTSSAQASSIVPVPRKGDFPSSSALSLMPLTNSSHSSWHTRFKEYLQATPSKRPYGCCLWSISATSAAFTAHVGALDFLDKFPVKTWEQSSSPPPRSLFLMFTWAAFSLCKLMAFTKSLQNATAEAPTSSGRYNLA